MRSRGLKRKLASLSGMFSRGGEPEDEYKRKLIRISESLADSSVDKSPVVRLLMQKAAPEGYNGVLIHLDEVIQTSASKRNPLLAEKIDELVKKAKSNGHYRLQVIVKSGSHYTPCDIDIKNRSLFVFDAAGDIRRAFLHTMAGYSKTIDKDKVFDVRSDGFVIGKRIINGGVIQKSQRGSWIISLRHSFYFASQKNLYDMISRLAQQDARDPVRKVSWFELPPPVVMMAQSTKFLENYMELHPELRSMMMALTKNNESNYGFTLIYNELKENLRGICREYPGDILRQIAEGGERENMKMKI